MGGIRLGSVFGIDIRIHLSWIIIFLLILWTFSALVFPTTYPGLSILTYAVMGVATTLVFFASLLVHELSHSLVARSKGIPVPAITLFIFGGVSHTTREADAPGDEFVIAVVGPLASLALGVLFALLWGAAVRAGGAVALVGSLQYLAIVNVALAVFNLLPGFPLDGGRIFRAAVWRFTGDMTRATRAAATAGKWVGLLLIGIGILQVFLGALTGGIWLIFIGWFLRNAAEAAYRQHVRRERPGGGEPPGEEERPGGRAA